MFNPSNNQNLLGVASMMNKLKNGIHLRDQEADKLMQQMQKLDEISIDNRNIIFSNDIEIEEE